MVANKKIGAGGSPSVQIAIKKGRGSLEGGPSRESVSGRFIVKTQRVKRLVELGFSSEEIYRVVAPRRTLDRRNKYDEPLTLAESDRVQRLERISAMANRVFGSEEKAHRWLRKPCRALDGAIPVEILASETGAHMVEEELHAIDFGMFV